MLYSNGITENNTPYHNQTSRRVPEKLDPILSVVECPVWPLLTYEFHPEKRQDIQNCQTVTSTTSNKDISSFIFRLFLVLLLLLSTETKTNAGNISATNLMAVKKIRVIAIYEIKSPKTQTSLSDITPCTCILDYSLHDNQHCLEGLNLRLHWRLMQMV